jgi:hypothetical protein
MTTDNMRTSLLEQACLEEQDGPRAQAAEQALAQYDRERAASNMLAALKTITDHFADVMGGPMIAGRGVNFANGVEGIPTIKAARNAIHAAESAGIRGAP